MPVRWDDRKSLYRLTGIAEELLVASRTARDQAALEAVGRQLGPLSREVHGLLEANDGAMADEFGRMVLGLPEDAVPVEIRAATLIGWLRASNAIEAADEERRSAEEKSAAEKPAGRKQTIGFKLRSVIGREPTASAAEEEVSPPSA